MCSLKYSEVQVELNFFNYEWHKIGTDYDQQQFSGINMIDQTLLLSRQLKLLECQLNSFLKANFFKQRKENIFKFVICIAK